MAWELVREPQGVLKRLSGSVSAEEFVQSVEAVQGHADFHAMRYVINDFSRVASHGLTDNVLIGLAALQYGAHAINPRCRIFFVTQDDELARLVNRHLVEGHLVSYEVVITRTEAQARLWLETQPATFRLNHRYPHRFFQAKTT